MIPLTRLSGSVFALNADLIERVDSTPDTVITLMNGTKYMVAEPMTTVIAIVRRHRAEVMALASLLEVDVTASPGDTQAWQAARSTTDASASVRRPNLLVVGHDQAGHEPDAALISPPAPGVARHSTGGSPS
ncbi:flagellar FlbD family protein [Nocardioides sp. R-C-SC26]|uniref:flagellar FlbD family protein n=1 Tax=Nocardioides sp. R-C-SC26 TaxID=2870414 RepID=UPI001E519C39|nr:flagellar FlbD family protein [Nocardioides sp. R-C-SC26]